MNYGNALMARGEFNGAWSCYQAGLALLPNYSYLYINMGILKNAVGDPLTAEACFKKAIELTPQNPESYVYYGKFLLDLKRYSDARQDIETGLKYSPQHDQLLSLKARLEAEGGKTDESPLDISIKRAANFPSPENYLELSLQYYYAGQFEMVIKAAEEALKLKPDYALAYNNICSAYNQLKQWDKAIAAGKKAVELDPNNQLAKNNLAEAIRQKELEN
jgi:protein O-mannosyl-transferase